MCPPHGGPYIGARARDPAVSLSRLAGPARRMPEQAWALGHAHCAPGSVASWLCPAHCGEPGSELHILVLLLFTHEKQTSWAAREQAGREVLVCHCSCQALTAPAHSPGALKGNTGLGLAHPIPPCAWPPMPGPCPFLDKASHTPATSRLRISNFMHPQPEPQPGLSSVFTLSCVAGTTLVPGQCGCEWRLDCWSADQCCRELSGYGHLCLPQGLGHPSVEQLLTPCLLATLAMPHLLCGYKLSPTLSGPWHLPL